MKKTILAALMFCSFAFGQSDAIRDADGSFFFSFFGETTTFPDVVTLQPTSAGKRAAYLDTISLCSSVAVTITLEVRGTAATATASTAMTPLNRSTATVLPVADTTIYTGSDVGTGTVLGKYDLPADLTKCQAIPLNGVVLKAACTGCNLTIRSTTVTGTLRRWVKWRERT